VARLQSWVWADTQVEYPVLLVRHLFEQVTGVLKPAPHWRSSVVLRHFEAVHGSVNKPPVQITPLVEGVQVPPNSPHASAR